ncbi:2-dehydropantoate 2-reductase N-terminal domain-containing protein [soil metagenome]
MRLVILGVGAIGGVVAGHLARANREVLALARGEHLEAIRGQGLRVDTVDGGFTVQIPCAAPTDRIDWRDDDVLVVATKTQDVSAALQLLGAPVHVPIVCLTNGLAAERIALRHSRQVYASCVRIPAAYLVPGTVQTFGTPIPGMLDLGRYPDGTGELADAIAGELVVAGFGCEVRANIMKWKRYKLLDNLANSAEALSGPAARTSTLAALAKAEGRAVYAAANLGCITAAEDEARRGAFRHGEIAGVPRGGGSTWQSLTKGGDLETDYLNGEIAMLGRLHGVATPINEALQTLASEAARTRQPAGTLPLGELIARIAT